jgi:predicted ATPase
MLEFIRIQRFKTLLDVCFPLSNLNVFSGLNGMGKSSVMQAILLLRQSYERNTVFDKGLLLKGDYVSLGTGQDILAEQAELNSFEFLLKWFDREPVKFNFYYSSQSDLQPIEKKISIINPELLSLFNGNFQYLSADRIGPKTSYDVSDYCVKNLNSIGIHGEYVAHFIAENGQKPICISDLKHHKASSMNLLENLDRWMSEISPGLRIHATMQPQLNSVSLSYAFEQGKEMTADFKPQNVGFGLTYVLPVVTAILRSKPGDLIIIENPESHLHPAGQSVLGRMCSVAANKNVQIFIESHSDHFLNGVRVAVKKGLIDAESVKLFFLDRNQDSISHSSSVFSPEIYSNGNIDYWPKGFFDESDLQLENLL